jgi:subtilisin family serine protease
MFKAFLLSIFVFVHSNPTFSFPLVNFEHPDVIPDQYIICLHQNNLKLEDTYDLAKNIFSLAKDSSYTILELYTFGFSVLMRKEVLNLLQSHKLIKYIEADTTISLLGLSNEQFILQRVEQIDESVVENGKIGIYGTQKKTPSWGLARVSQRAFKNHDKYSYPNSGGQNVSVYVIDTGVFVEHSDFQGRASWGKSFSNLTERDEHGHGTHVATTIAGKIYGVAKKTRIISVRVLNERGVGSLSVVISGIEWATSHAVNSGSRAIINLSIGASYSESLNRAVINSIAAGVHIVVAAGNKATDACNFSPGITYFKTRFCS